MDKSNLSEIAFFGKITAGITHELKNVLAVIKETSGLMSDLLELSEGENFQHTEKFQKALSTIQRQIENGVGLLKHLNAFAHAPDKERAEIDLYEIVNEMAVLCKRRAGLKNITLTPLLPDKMVKFTTCQVSLQMIIFLCLEYCISHLPQYAKIDISVVRKDDTNDCLIKFGCGEELSNIETLSAEEERVNALEILQKTADEICGNVLKEPLSLILILSSPS